MASMAMTQVQSPSAIFLLLAVILVGVQGRLNPDDFTFVNQPQIPINPRFFDKTFPESTTHFESQPTNLDESSQFGTSSQNTQDASGFKQPRGGETTRYNYAMEDTNKFSDDYFTPEELARIRAFNEAQLQAKLDREIQNYEAPVKTTTTSGGGQYPKVLPDGTEILWVRGPQNATPEEMARLGAMTGKPNMTGKPAAALPGVQRNEVQGSTDLATDVFTVDSSSWEDGPWGTKHRPGAEQTLEYVGVRHAGGSNDALPASYTNP